MFDYDEYGKVYEYPADNKFESVCIYNNGATFCEREDEDSLRFVYSCIDELIEEGLVRFEVYEIVEILAYVYDKYEQVHYEKTIDEHRGKLIYSEEF